MLGLPHRRRWGQNLNRWGSFLPTLGHRTFRVIWRSSNLLLAVAFVSMLYSWHREYSVRWYLDGFSDAIVSNTLPAAQRVEAILSWMRDRKSTRLNSSHLGISYAVFCLKKKKKQDS